MKYLSDYMERAQTDECKILALKATDQAIRDVTLKVRSSKHCQ